jgi:uncharacterized protein
MSPSPKDPASLLRMLDARTAPATPDRRPREVSAPKLASLLPHAATLERAGGACACVTANADLSGRRSPEGYLCPVEPFAVPDTQEALARLTGDVAWREVDPGQVAYVDIETTSLQGGSGTVAFLVGVGRYEAEGFRVRQFFMEDFHEEPALIEAVEEELRGAQAVVSYNGKCFDLPILEMRWRLARRRPSFPALHLDLLYPARRLWRGRLPDCRLGTVERDILGVMRVSDAPSAEIPQIYFDYVRGIRPQRMGPVFDHHAQDIFSLAALTQAFARAVADPDDSRFAHVSDQSGLARLHRQAGDAAAAEAALRRAIGLAGDEDAAYRLSMLLARGLRRGGRRTEAAAIWERWAEKAAIHRLDPLIELAKHAEHDLKDSAAAEGWTRRALEIVEHYRELDEWIGASNAASGALIRQLEDLSRRLKRLGEKRGRAATARD